MKLVLPLPPNMANSRMHWRTKQKARKSYFSDCPWWGAAAEPLTRARIRATLYVWNRMDADNLMARLKWPVDWLVACGYIKDDGPDVLEWEMPQQVVDRKNQRVEIELEEIDGVA